MALQLGVGEDGSRSFFYRRAEAEHLTREKSTRTQVNSWLTIEYVPEEILDFASIAAQVVRACDEIKDRLAWQHGPPVLLTILAADTDAPWLPGRFGVFIRKNPYNKICIPYRAAIDPGRLHSVVIHEYAHEIVEDLTQGQAPRWLNEMVATTAEGRVNPNVGAAFASGQLTWLNPTRLNIEYINQYEGRADQRFANPYEQSAWIGRYLVNLKGEKQLAVMLKEFESRNVVEEIVKRILNSSPTERAMKRAYGMGQREIFARALQWLKGSKV